MDTRTTVKEVRPGIWQGQCPRKGCTMVLTQWTQIRNAREDARMHDYWHAERD